MNLLHFIAVRLPRCSKHPFVRRSAFVCKGSVLPASCVIGERVKIKGHEGRLPVFGESVFVNDDSVIWGDVKIGCGVKIHQKCFVSDCGYSEKGFSYEPVVIGDYVIVEAHSIICKGVKIGNAATVLAGSVVTQSVPSMAIVSGNPARIVEVKQ